MSNGHENLNFPLQYKITVICLSVHTVYIVLPFFSNNHINILLQNDKFILAFVQAGVENYKSNSRP